MMHALLLPGNSPRHADWIERLKLALSPYFQSVATQHYHHWQTGAPQADIDYEITVAEAQVKQHEPYMIIAKSIGTAIAIKGTATGKLRPAKLILLGVPSNGGVSTETFAAWLVSVTVPVVFVQNTGDPYGSFTEVRAAFDNQATNRTFVELPGDTHDYLDFRAIASLL